MKIDSTVANGMNVKHTNEYSEKAVRVKSSQDIDPEARKISNEELTNKDSEDITEEDMLDSAVKQANKTLEAHDRVIERYIHEKTHSMMYVIKDRKTGEVIKEFPPKKIEDMIAKMWELAGLFVDERR